MAPEPLRSAALEVGTGSAEQTRALARSLGTRLRGGDVVVLNGELGAGKTTFVQGLALGLGVTAPVTSPTFVLARHQRNDPVGPRPGGPDLVHVDAYRLQGALELDDLDLDSDLDTSVVVVEWGAGLAERLSPDRVEVRLGRTTGAGAGPGAGASPEVGAGDRTREEQRTVRLDVVGLEDRDLLTGLVGHDPSSPSDPSARPTTEPETPC